MNYSEEQIAKLAQDIFDGRVDPYNLPENLYKAIADYLKKGLYKGFGGDLASAFETKDLALLEELRENIYVFSAAKTFKQVQDMTDLLVDEDGSVRPWRSFRDAFEEVYGQYDNNWLEAEYNTAIGEAQSAVRWENIEKNKAVLPMLKYSAVMDDHTSDLCASFDGIVLPVDDDFWDEYMPPNHFNCRCTVEQLEEDEEKQTPDDDVESAVKEADVPEAFRFNAGKDRIIFSDEHPYFDVAPKDVEFARNNFNLPIPEKD